MPDEMLKKLDEAARKEHRSRSELLREAARRHLMTQAQAATGQSSEPDVKRGIGTKKSKGSLRGRLLELGIGRKYCPGLDRLVGPVQDRVDMRRVLRISRKLTGLSREIIESREDRW